MLSFSQQSRNYHHFAKGDDNDDGKGVGKCGKRAGKIEGGVAVVWEGWGQLGGNVDKVCTLLTGPNCDICVGWGHSGPKTKNWFLNLNEKAIKS